MDPGAATATLTSSGAGPDGFVAKLDEYDNNYVWSARRGSAGPDSAGDIVTSGDCRVFLTGMIESHTAFVEWLDLSGISIWTGEFASNDGGNNLSMAADPSGNLFATGQFATLANPDTGGDIRLISSGLLVQKLIPTSLVNGSFGMAFSLGPGSGIDTGRAVATDSLGNIYVAGRFYSAFGRPVGFDPGPGAYNLTSGPSENAFVAKSNSAGALAWARRLGSTGNQDLEAIDIGVDNARNVFTVGTFSGTVDMDPGSTTFYLSIEGGP